MAIAPRNNDRFAATGMKSVADDGLSRLIVGIMKLFRRCLEPSSVAGNSRSVCQLFDLLGNTLDALIETPPIAAEVLDDPDHTR